MHPDHRIPQRTMLLRFLALGLAGAWLLGLAGTGAGAQASPVRNGGPIATAVALVTSPNPSTQGGRFTMTATVSPVSGTDVPSGMVTFFDGAIPIVQARVGLAGPAVVTTARLTMGTHLLTAEYSGDDAFEPSSSAPVTQVVDPGSGSATTTTLSSTPNPAAFGQVVSYTATVTEVVPLGTPTGAVTFYRTEAGQPPTWIGTADIIGGTDATLELADLGTGTYSIIAEYTGDPTHLASEAGEIEQTITNASTTTVLGAR